MTNPWGASALYSAKTAAAALAALGISLAVGLPMPFWAMTTVYITSNPLAGATRSKAIYRVIGTMMGAAVAVGLVPLLVEWPPLLSLALAAWLGVCLALSLLDRSPRSYVLMLAGYTAAIIAFPSVNRPEAVFDTATARVTEIVLGIACATVSHSLFWPASVGERLAPRLALWLRDAEIWLRDAMQASPNSAADRRRLAVDALDCVLMSTHIPYDTSHWREATRSVQALLYRMLMLLPLVSGLTDRRLALGEDAAVADANAQMLGWLEEGLDTAPVPAFRPTAQGHSWADLLRESYLVRLAQAARLLAEARSLHRGLTSGDFADAAGLVDSRIPLRLHSDGRLAILSGIAAALAVLIACFVWIVTGWADGAGAAVMAGVFCCLFAAMDNPVPAILSFGGAILASIPLAAVYLFGIMPMLDGFGELALALLPVLLGVGMLLMHPRLGLPAIAFLVGFCSAIAIQETFTANFEKFLNGNIGQIFGMVVAAGVTAFFRSTGADAALARLVAVLRNDLANLASATRAPDPAAVLARASDQLALITQRLGADSQDADAGLRELRIAMNIATLQGLRLQSQGALADALERMMHSIALHFGQKGKPVPPALLGKIDKALRLSLGDGRASSPSGGLPSGGLIDADPVTARAALVALRRNLFPAAPDFSPEPRP